MLETYQNIGETAGKIYRALETSGSLSLALLQKETGVNDAALIYQALGWLAREEKIDFEKKGKFTAVHLLAARIG